jgi:hypothetical protein
MRITLSKELALAVGLNVVHHFIGFDDRYLDQRKSIDFDLRHGTMKDHEEGLSALEKALNANESIRGAKAALKDVQTWRKLMAGNDTVKARTAEHFQSILHETLRRTPRQVIYYKDHQRNAHHAYHVSPVEYVPEKRDGRDTYDEYVWMRLWWWEFDELRSKTVSFFAHECERMSVAQALALKGYCIETDELRAEYLVDLALYDAIVPRVGVQFTAVGAATDDLDGNLKRRDGWWSRQNTSIQLDTAGEPARVAIDVFRELKAEPNRAQGFSRWYWSRNIEGEMNESEVPRHAFVACFDLRRHLRVRVHVRQLTEYAYDPHLRNKLVLPTDHRALVEMLLAHKGVFRDIIHGKGGGAIILCAGRPGTGKTLTAEVYSESTGRPLYSVQASQLGTNPSELEDELHKVFARATRWNAILLIDEADVYVAARGANLMQNAIVGVLLRVLEYYRGVMFLTTNRADIVDDAVASRCIARLDYDVPPVEDQRRIWRILADTSGLALTDEVIDAIVTKYPRLSGRDVKNILKLAAMVAAAREGDGVIRVAVA